MNFLNTTRNYLTPRTAYHNDFAFYHSFLCAKFLTIKAVIGGQKQKQLFHLESIIQLV